MMNVSQKIYSNIFNKIPPKTVEGEKAIRGIDTIGKIISSPQNRLIMGVTALASQPFIDLHNKDVDEDTRIVSCSKTLGKIISGTVTGVTIRHLAIKLAEKMSRTPEDLEKLSIKPNKFNTFFSTPNLKPHKTEYYKQYRNFIGTAIGIGVMLITNFAIDLPLTNFLTNFFAKKFRHNGSESPVKEKGGAV
jgi:hypothetical protein